MHRKTYQAYRRRLTDRSGREIPGHLGASPEAVKGVVVVVHDFFGLTGHVKGLVSRLGAEGYVGFAPDLYRGAVATSADEAAALARKTEWTWKNIATEIGLGVSALTDQHPGARLGVVGFGMGGAAAVVAAAAVDRITAAVTFYGIPQDVIVESKRVHIQGHFAGRDRKSTPERVDAFEQSLRARGVPGEIHRYDADSGFFNPTRADVYSAVDAARAWERVIAFFKTAIG